MKTVLSLLLFFALGLTQAVAQDTSKVKVPEKSALSGFFLTGNGFINFEKSGSSGFSLVHTSLSPILLWKISNNLFFESELELSLEDGKTTADLGYATLHYVFNKYLILGGGKFLSPFGTFQERLHPAWVNKFSEAPLGFSHDGIIVGPMAEVGFEVRGGSPLGNSKINYVAYVSNGPAISSNPSDPMMGGMLESGKFKDNNNDKAVGARIGFLPFSNSSMEIGVSWQNAYVGEKGDSIYGKAKVAMHAIDFSYTKGIEKLKGIVEIKSQLNNVLLDKGNNQMVEMSSKNSYDVRQAWYSQISFRPGMHENKIIRNLEFACRYSVLELPQGNQNAGRSNQISFGINYWYNWSSVIKLAYQVTQIKGKENEGLFLIQLAVCDRKTGKKKISKKPIENI